MGNFGYAALFVALLASVYSAITFASAAKSKSPGVTTSARNALLAVSGLVTLSVIILMIAIFTHNFSLEYVSSYTSLNSSPAYLLSALWAGNSGSLLFWAWLLSIFSLVVYLRKQDRNRELMPYAAMVLMINQAFILVLLVIVTNPFNQVSVIPADGLGLNPLLENLGMVFHPPALLAGYVGLTVPFAFAVSAMLTRKVDDEWLMTTRRWMLLAWLLLGVGNIIGAWWAYVELGWGGYWAWDPVENAGLMPWLLATAFLHSSIMQRRRGKFRVWNMVLIILTFCLVIFGTFLTRSGILSSVHTFNDTGMTPFFMTFLGIVFFGSLLLLYYRYDDLKGEGGSESIISRESTFFFGNILLVASTFIILIGTVFQRKESFFNLMNGSLFLVIILLVGICTLIGWRKLSGKGLFGSILWPLVAALVLAILLFIIGVRQPVALIAFFICSLVLFSILTEWFTGANARHRNSGDNIFKAWWDLLRANTQRYGGYIVHIGIVLMAIGVIGSSFYSVEKEDSLKVGDSININQYTVTYDGLSSRDTPDKTIYSAKLLIYDSDRLIDNLVSEKIYHKSQEQPVTEVAIRSNPAEDLYVILEGWEENGATAYFKVLVNPLVSWIWIGGAVFLLGGLVTFWPGNANRLSSKMSPGNAGSN